MSVRVYSGLGSGAFLGQDALAHFFEARLLCGGLNDGDPVATAAMVALCRWGGPGTASFQQPVTQVRAGATQFVYRQRDAMRWFEPQPGVAAYSTVFFRRFTGGGILVDASDFRDTYGATTSPVAEGAIPRPLAIHLGAWFRKVNAGDATTANFCFGFADNTVLSPTGKIARCGLLGDGVLGYRFGSVNCPDAGALAGNNLATDIDANSVQPPELVNPGVTKFYVELGLVPPTPVTGGFWFAKLNGRIAVAGGAQAIFRQVANFPRSSTPGVVPPPGHDYNRIEGLWLSHEGTQGAVPLSSQVSAIWTEDLTFGGVA